MAKFIRIKRQEILISLIRNYPFISKKQLVERMENDYDIQITTRTLERDFTELKTELGIDISYNRYEKGYFIEEESKPQLVHFLQFAGRIFLGELFREALKDFEDLKKRIKPEDYSYYEGVEFMEPVLVAIRNHLDIGFIHENFQRNTKTPYRITPLQLREFDRRWYVVGVPEHEDHIKTFGLSRISNLKTLEPATIRLSDFEEQLKKFDRIVGLNYDGADKPKIIRIAIDSEQYKYLKTLPLHRSQKFEKTLPGNKVEVSFFLIPNYELKMQLLKMGDRVEVLEPLFLREEIKDTLENAFKNYHSSEE